MEWHGMAVLTVGDTWPLSGPLTFLPNFFGRCNTIGTNFNMIPYNREKNRSKIYRAALEIFFDEKEHFFASCLSVLARSANWTKSISNQNIPVPKQCWFHRDMHTDGNPLGLLVTHITFFWWSRDRFFENAFVVNGLDGIYCGDLAENNSEAE